MQTEIENDKFGPLDDSDKNLATENVVDTLSADSSMQERVKVSVNHRRLNARQIQLTSIAGSIGAALFVAIGYGVLSGPLCLLLAFIFWASVVYSIAQCRRLPVSSTLISRNGDRHSIPL